MTHVDSLETISEEIAIGADTGHLSNDQLRYINRHLESFGPFPGEMGKAARRFQDALLHHQLCNRKHDPDDLRLAYAHVGATWIALRPHLVSVTQQAGQEGTFR